MTKLEMVCKVYKKEPTDKGAQGLARKYTLAEITRVYNATFPKNKR